MVKTNRASKAIVIIIFEFIITDNATFSGRRRRKGNISIELLKKCLSLSLNGLIWYLEQFKLVLISLSHFEMVKKLNQLKNFKFVLVGMPIKFSDKINFNSNYFLSNDNKNPLPLSFLLITWWLNFIIL